LERRGWGDIGTGPHSPKEGESHLEKTAGWLAGVERRGTAEGGGLPNRREDPEIPSKRIKGCWGGLRTSILKHEGGNLIEAAKIKKSQKSKAYRSRPGQQGH